MNKISIDKKYYFNFIDISAEEVKKILLSLLEENFDNLNDSSKMLAKIIYSDNFNISSLRKKAINSRWESYPQKSYPQSIQNIQTIQNIQPSPPTSPTSRLIINKNNKINQEAGTQDENLATKHRNCFSSHLEDCLRVPIRSDEERKPFVDMFTVIMDEIKYHKAYQVAMYEIIDTIIEMYDKVKADKRFRFGKIYIYQEDITKIVLGLTYSDLEPLLKQLAYRNTDESIYTLTKSKPTTIKNHPYYILSSLLKNLSKGELKNGEKV